MVVVAMRRRGELAANTAGAEAVEDEVMGLRRLLALRPR